MILRALGKRRPTSATGQLPTSKMRGKEFNAATELPGVASGGGKETGKGGARSLFRRARKGVWVLTQGGGEEGRENFSQDGEVTFKGGGEKKKECNFCMVAIGGGGGLRHGVPKPLQRFPQLPRWIQ